MACRRRRLPEANQAGDPAIYKAAARESTMRVTHARYDNNDTPALARQP